MSWSFRIEQKQRMIWGLGILFLLVILAYWFVGYTMNQVSHQFKSAYYDRLVPALDISAMQERYYQNRLLLEETLLTPEQTQHSRQHLLIQANLTDIDSILIKYKATRLTKQEKADLQNFLLAKEQLDIVQKTILTQSAAGNKEAALLLYRTKGQEAFLKLLEPLHALSHLQQEVGHELYTSAERQIKALRILSYLVIALAVIIALLISTLLQTNRKLSKIKPQKFNLN